MCFYSTPSNKALILFVHFNGLQKKEKSASNKTLINFDFIAYSRDPSRVSERIVNVPVRFEKSDKLQRGHGATVHDSDLKL